MIQIPPNDSLLHNVRHAVRNESNTVYVAFCKRVALITRQPLLSQDSWN